MDSTVPFSNVEGLRTVNAPVHRVPVLQAPRLLADFETRSECSLKTAGAYRYAEDPTTQILCLSWRIGHGEAQLWTPWVESYEEYEVEKTSGRGKNKQTYTEIVREPAMVYRPDLCPFPQEIIDHILNGGAIEAHNAGFERAIWHAILTKQFGVPHCSRWVDTMAACAYRGLPLDLFGAGTALNLDVLKDTEGKDILRKISQPRKPTKNDKRKWNNSPELFKKCFAYCIRDNDAEYVLGQHVGDLPDTEYKVWVLDQIINTRGVMVDVAAVHGAQAIADKAIANMDAEINDLTQGEIESGTKRDRIKNWLAEKHEIDLPDMTAGTIKEVLKNPRLPAFDKADPSTYGRRVIEIRREVSRTSTAKFQAMLDARCSDDRIRGLLQYHGAGTGRWAGRLVQPQNFPRPKVNGKPFKEKVHGSIDALVAMLLFEEPELIRALYGPEMETLAAALRGMLIPAPGKKFVVVDFSSIEARIVLWLAGQMEAMDIFRKADAKQGPDIYCYLASDLYGRTIDKDKDPDERQLGKIGTLGCFGAETLVWTDAGLRPLLSVRKTDRVWDGVQWVKHGGVIAQGRKQVFQLNGIVVTPDHLFLQDGEWREASYIGAKSTPWKREVYDLADCGPLHRFTVQDATGTPHIVHNCGYQMSAPRLQEQAHDDYELDLPIETCEKIVKTYRTTFDKVPTFWREINNTACAAVEAGLDEPRDHRGIVYTLEEDAAGRWLSARLPNGKKIWYYNPKVTYEPVPPAVVKKYPKMAGKMFPKLWYEGRDNKRGGLWTTISTYGGMETENLVQAIAREIMVEAMVRAEVAGYKIVLTVHDELVCEVDEDFGSHKELEKIASQTLPWCADLPIAAEGWSGFRYKKA